MSIGTFASLGGVSIKAVRLYSNRGLLVPEHKAPGSRYRLYPRLQLARLHRILLLKSVGIPLAAIREQLERPDRQVLSEVRQRLVQRLDDTRRQLEWVDLELDRPQDIAEETHPPVVVKQVPKLLVRSKRQRLSSYDETDGVLEGLGRTMPVSARAMAGAVWHGCGEQAIDCEAFWVVSGRVAGTLNALPPIRVASAIHHGTDQTIGRTYRAIRQWIDANGFDIAGPNREIYIDSAERDTGPALTEVQFPSGRAREPTSRSLGGT
jgi:DNA-binding transcriptional MerR regulator